MSAFLEQPFVSDSDNKRRRVTLEDSRETPSLRKQSRTSHGFKKFKHVLPSLDANGILLHLNHNNHLQQRVPCNENPSSRFADSEEDSYPREPVIDEGGARRQIQLICRTPACWRSDNDQAHMLHLLKLYPSLASQVFDWDYNLFSEHGNEWSSPLSFLLYAGADLEIIQTVYDLYPAAISHPSGIHRDLPLHFACRFGASTEVLNFLISKFPVSVCVSNSSGMLPIHLALGKHHIRPYGQFHHASLSTISILVNLYPHSLVKQEEERGYTPLQVAFNHGYSFEVIDYMIGQLSPQIMDEFKLVAGCYHNRLEVVVGLAKSVLISKLLPHLKRFHCEPTDWEIEGIVQQLACLQQNTSLVEYRATNLPAFFLKTPSVMQALSELLLGNKSLETLHLSMKDINNNVDASEFLDYVCQGLKFNRCLEALHLSNMSFSLDSLLSFMASPWAPKKLFLKNFKLRSRGKQFETLPFHSNNQVSSLTVSNLHTDDQQNGEILTLLHTIAKLPLLQELKLHLPGCKSLDVTDPIVALLNGNFSLKRMSIHGPTANTEDVCRSLENNRALRQLDFSACFDTQGKLALLGSTLESHNATLERIQLPSHAGAQTEQGKIRYWTLLNRCGRAVTQNPSATKSSLVNLLRDVERAAFGQANDKPALLFGLLRESPYLWCNI